MRSLVAILALLLTLVPSGCRGHAIPIWELLSYQEKMGRVLYILVHLVERYCDESKLPDCRKVVTMYGVANLLNEEETGLDLLDPYQRDSHNLIWRAAMRSKFPFPKSSDSNDTRDIDLAFLDDQHEFGPGQPTRVLPPSDFRIL